MCTSRAFSHCLTRVLLEDGKQTIKVLVAIRNKEYVQGIASAMDRRGAFISTESTNHLRVYTVTISDFHIVIATAMVKFQA